MPSLTIKTTPEEFKLNSNKFNVATVHGVVEPIELRPVEAFKSLQSTKATSLTGKMLAVLTSQS